MNDPLRHKKTIDQATEYLIIYGCAFPLILALNVLTFSLLALFIHKIGLF